MKWYAGKKIYLRKIYIYLTLIGIDLKKLFSLGRIFRFIREYYIFKNKKPICNVYPCLEDYDNQANEFKNQFFHADLLVAQYIYEDNPKNHLDIGSRIDGLVSHVASFRKIDVIDVRGVDIQPHKNIFTIQKDIIDSQDSTITEKYESISSIGVLAHIGLGRYGDKIDADGHLKAIDAICKLALKGCKIYIMTPVGKKKIEFNAHRIFEPEEIINRFALNNCELLKFSLVNDDGNLEIDTDIKKSKHLNFGGGIYFFKKN